MEKAFANDLIGAELRRYGLSADGAEPISSKDGTCLARVKRGGGTAILKCFERAELAREIENYEILASCSVPTIEVFGKSSRSILLEDIEASAEYRLGKESDLSDRQVIGAIAKWYRTLHENGAKYVRKFGAGMYEEWDCFTLENIERIRERFGLAGNEGLGAIEKAFEKLRKRMDEVPRTLTYNDFYYTNLVVKKDGSEAKMFDYDLLGKGSRASDIRNVIYWFGEEERRLFFSVYGEPREEELLLEAVVSPVVTLSLAMERSAVPDWAREAIRELDEVTGLIERL